MKSIFNIMDVKTMLQLNIVSILVTAICEVFALYIFLTKGQSPELEHWKYVAIVIGLVIISLLFIGSIVSLILFIITKNNRK
ncbi:MAG: hypothetical protein ACERKD_06330 [Prolixibacteraceae bacterium]